MTLANPYIQYVAIRDAIVTLLRDNKATLNAGLTSTFSLVNNTQINPGNIYVTPTVASLYPVIMVKVVNKKEEWSSLGAGGRKRPSVVYRVYGLTRIVDGVVDTEIMTLAKNIEAVFRNNITISGNVIYCSPAVTDFGVGEFAKGVYVDVVSIDVECMIEII